MKRIRPGRRALIALALGWVVTVSQAQEIVEFPLPPGVHAGSIVVGHDNALWFTITNAEAGSIGRITTTGETTTFPLPDAGSLGRMVRGTDGNLWFSAFSCTTPACSVVRNKIGRVTMAGVVTEFPAPYAGSLAAGPDGNLWFVEPDARKIGRLTPDGSVTEFDVGVPTNRLGSITAGPDGALWFTASGIEPVLGGCVTSKVGRVTTAGAMTWFELPGCGARLGDITAGPEGNLWFLEQQPAGIGRLDPISGVITEFRLPLPNQPAEIVAGPDGSLWFTQPFAGRIGRIAVDGTITQSVTLGSPLGVTAGPDGALWFTHLYETKIGRMTVPGGLAFCVPDTQSLCLGGGRFRATATYRNPTGPGIAAARELSRSSGFFTFDNPDSVELVVKVLNACSFGGGVWVFAAGLTDQEVTLTVTDTETEEARTYFNPLGTTFVTITDTAAFSTCP